MDEKAEDSNSVAKSTEKRLKTEELIPKKLPKVVGQSNLDSFIKKAKISPKPTNNEAEATKIDEEYPN